MPGVGSQKTIWSHFNPLYHSFTVKYGREGLCVVVVCIYSYSCTHTHMHSGMVLPLCMLRAVTYLALGRKAVSGLWNHQPVKVKSDSKRDKADWHGNGIRCLCAKRPD